MSGECKDFIKQCLLLDSQKRLGTQNDLTEILSHPWFANINQKALENKEIKPNFRPVIRSKKDIANFGDEF